MPVTSEFSVSRKKAWSGTRSRFGGSSGNDTRIGERLGAAIPKDEVASTLRKILDVYREERLSGETFVDAVQRLGIEPFRNRVYEDQDHENSRRRRVAAA